MNSRTTSSLIAAAIVWSVVTGLGLAQNICSPQVCSAFVGRTGFRCVKRSCGVRRRCVSPGLQTRPTVVKATTQEDDDENLYVTNNGSGSSNNSGSVSLRRRAQFSFVTVSPNGFWVILKIGDNRFLPMQITDTTMDQASATTPEALTVLQLLSDVDMAGAILPPDALAQLVVRHCEEKVELQKNEVCKTSLQIVKAVKEELPPNNDSYSSLHQWFRSRMRLPVSTLDEVVVCLTENEDKAILNLQVAVKDFGILSVRPSEDTVQEICYDYRPATSAYFLGLALALRYKSPVVLEAPSDAQAFLTMQQIEERFPMYTTVDRLQQTSSRVTANIEKSFQINQLQAALRIALEKGDAQAAVKIRAQLDIQDSMEDLPTQPESETDKME
ncbi:predicted protein [Phaeodactylum tricornutum CCAP 1055/1]|uniref:Uncharacterized protein n=1 Tax=Phaeodactylum tricornutum (strain CCAP 1055/1) TaxID=556484 RepID=B7FTM1_PHATC|nr:predicted protein [Phaeodactylum tricornutum CCAP 1055/1]EEC50104.1 predicted protein [Phaeodactylum tricornutum CCAP 1055/1]|eukprot:XP_002178439.1 predicted protein [Phaeodactylum tricornutum CCAP 1055/1]